MTKEIDIFAQVTPNPNTLKFVSDVNIIAQGSIEFPTANSGNESPLATEIFNIDGVQSIMFGTHFVSVTKAESADWTALAEPVTKTIRGFLEAEKEAIPADVLEKKQAEQKAAEQDGGSEAEQKIKRILNEEIRPAVAMDGGDVQFHSFEDGILTLQLQGACSSCPSATFTLKMGIENRLKEDIPEIKEVVQL